jgi:hypothetical protein
MQAFVLGLLLSASAGLLAQGVYDYFSPGGALTGTATSQSVDLTQSGFVSGPLRVGAGGTGTNSTLTGLVRGGSPLTASELSSEVTTSGSNAATVTRGLTANVGTNPWTTSPWAWSNAEPRLVLCESDQGADLKCWDWDVNGSIMTFRTRTDADGAGKTWLQVNRGATTAISSLSLGNATDNPSFNWSGTGQFNVTGGSLFTSAGTAQVGKLVVTSSAVPANGLNLPAANTLGFAANTTQVGTWTTTQLTPIGGIQSGGTKFTASGCGNSATVGGAIAGQFTSGTTGTCTVTLTLPTATNGWACHADDLTTPANFIGQSASTTTSCTVQGTTVSADVIVFSAMAF